MYFFLRGRRKGSDNPESRISRSIQYSFQFLVKPFFLPIYSIFYKFLPVPYFFNTVPIKNFIKTLSLNWMGFWETLFIWKLLIIQQISWYHLKLHDHVCMCMYMTRRRDWGIIQPNRTIFRGVLGGRKLILAPVAIHTDIWGVKLVLLEFYQVFVLYINKEVV